jgi:hypothetical protein
VHNTDRIMLRVLSVGATQGRLSLAGGPLAPGLTPESDGSPEVEVVASVTDEEDELRLEGTAGADHLRGGRVGGVNEVNLNPAAAGDSPDPDLRLKRTGRATLAFRTGPTGDVVVMNGGPEFSEPLDVTGFVGAALGQGADRYAASQSRSYVQAGTGRDSIETGRRGDLVFAGPGADRVTTGPRQDAILLDLGRDRLSSGRGRDIVAALDRRRDRIDCGPGRDRVFADPRDRLKSCERVKHTVRDESG